MTKTFSRDDRNILRINFIYVEQIGPRSWLARTIETSWFTSPVCLAGWIHQQPVRETAEGVSKVQTTTKIAKNVVVVVMHCCCCWL
jgi:hypothetical protein